MHFLPTGPSSLSPSKFHTLGVDVGSHPETGWNSISHPGSTIRVVLSSFPSICVSAPNATLTLTSLDYGPSRASFTHHGLIAPPPRQPNQQPGTGDMSLLSSATASTRLKLLERRKDGMVSEQSVLAGSQGLAIRR
ncbi:hypothetical protein KQX54_005254 [Cotesia glomerata]|uniref:Uncharacterized protein n=1 Tax=Cotesia glomerata TaxID=32391 RepID=A0AAV7I113_COTGL|nr:hypothetical protein KQX54_005254 [Cotesia glomerata]